MMREWRDPRDDELWRIDALPFDIGPGSEAVNPTGWTLIFITHEEHCTLPVGYEIGVHLSELSDNLMRTLLDAARSQCERRAG